MKRRSFAFVLIIAVAGCKAPALTIVRDPAPPPASYGSNIDSNNTASLGWKQLFKDPYLQSLVDTAMKNNFELASTLRETEIARYEAIYRKASLFPVVSIGAGLGVDKSGRYTSEGAGNASTEMTPGKKVPEPLTDIAFGFQASWEADIRGKLRNMKKAAEARYLATVEGRNFLKTSLVAEIANSYYELVSLDAKLQIIQQAVNLQKNELEIVRIQKQAAAANELAVKQFEAQVLNIQGLEFEIRQEITETENRINFLLGRYPQPIDRDSISLNNTELLTIKEGIPSQLLVKRPDIKQAELQLIASKLDLRVARAEFFPELKIIAGLGSNAFNPTYFTKMPESLIYSLAADAMAPLINRKALKAEFNIANATQTSSLINYQRSILNGFMEVSNELSRINNLNNSYTLKKQQVETLNRSIDISRDLFRSARANYLEVLIAQRDALDTKLELVDTRLQQFIATVNLYRALGGGWK